MSSLTTARTGLQSPVRPPTRATALQPVLVTGAGGFIGRHVVTALLGQGRRVRALVRRPDDAAVLAELGAETMIGDLTDASATLRAAVGVRTVFHLAGRLYAPGTKPEDYERLHVDATARLLEACVAAGPLDCFVLCTTTGVHGPTGEDPAREDDAGVPQNAYEITKAHAEVVARDIATRHGAPLVIARPGLVYGPGDLHLAGWFRSIRDGYYYVVGRGTNHQHPIYIDDLVRGLLLCASGTVSRGRAFHLVGDRPVTMRELSDAIGAAVGRPVSKTHLPAALAYVVGASFELLPIPRRSLPLSRSRVRFLTQNRAYDGTRARDELGFTPHVGLAEGLEKTVAWYRAEGLL